MRRRSASIGLVIVVANFVMAFAAPALAPHNPLQQSLTNRLLSPRPVYRMGTDSYGRDVLSRTIWGSRVSVEIGILSVIVGASLGTVLGIIPGYWGGRIDSLVMRVVDVGMAFPMLLLAITIVALFGRGMSNLIVAIGVSNIPHFARLTRGETLRLRQMGYVESARALGATSARVVLRHVLPNLMATIVVFVTLRTSFAVLTESSLSFLGLGLPPPTPSWGVMLAEGQRFLTLAPWISVVPGTAIALLVLGLNLVGDGLRDALDPRLNAERGGRI